MIFYYSYQGLGNYVVQPFFIVVECGEAAVLFGCEACDD